MPRHEERFCKQYITGTVFLLATTLFVSSERTSGLYVNNGLGQTIAQRIATHKEKREVGYELLKLLGLPDRPKKIARSGLLVKRSAPKYLLNIYKQILSYDHDGGSTEDREIKAEFRVSDQDRLVIDRSDVIMSFAARNPHVGHENRNNRGRRIWFDVSEVPPGERIIAAELRLYRSFDADGLDHGAIYTVAIYRVARTDEGERVKHFVDSTNITIDREGWIALDIGESLRHWVNHPEENRGLFLAVHRADRTDRSMRPDDIGIVGVLGVPGKQPFMVGFFEGGATRTNSDARQRRRSTDGLENREDRGNRYLDPKVRKRAKACNLQNLYVSFKDLQWQDWIIAPEGYDAYYCSGECSFPLNTHMNATNHAVVQTLVHLMKPEKVPKPCCVPTKLSPISVLYFLDDSNVVLKKYKNMVVNSCGCH